MILICEQDETTLERTCQICEAELKASELSRERTSVGIDENDLAWFYIAPGYENKTMSRAVLAFARDLIGPNAWAVVQASDAESHRLCSDLGLHIVASYANQAEASSGITVHVVHTGEPL